MASDNLDNFSKLPDLLCQYTKNYKTFHLDFDNFPAKSFPTENILRNNSNELKIMGL